MIKKQKEGGNTIDIKSIAELKKRVIVNAAATGNTFAFHDLFSKIREFGGPDDSGVDSRLLDHLGYLLPAGEAVDSQDMRDAAQLVEECKVEGEAVPAALLEATAGRAVELGKFAFAEDAYRLLGIKKEMVALYAQAGEQFLRDGKPRHAAMSFFAAASIDRPIEPHYQYLGPRLHSACHVKPDECVTTLSLDSLLDAGIHHLLPDESLADRLIAAARPENKSEVVATLAVCRDLDFPALLKSLKAATAEFLKLDGDKSADYASLGPMLLGRQAASGAAWQYLREFCSEHPVGALCVCIKMVKGVPFIVPAVRDGKSLIELVLPSDFLST